MLPKEGNPALGSVTPGQIDLALDAGQSQTEVVTVVLGDYIPMIDVFLLFDDTGSFSGYPSQLAQTFPKLIETLMILYPETDFGFGVGRFEDYGYRGGNGSDLPFMLDQPILPTSYEGFTEYNRQALSAYHSGDGGDVPESMIYDAPSG